MTHSISRQEGLGVRLLRGGRGGAFRRRRHRNDLVDRWGRNRAYCVDFREKEDGKDGMQYVQSFGDSLAPIWATGHLRPDVRFADPLMLPCRPGIASSLSTGTNRGPCRQIHHSHGCTAIYAWPLRDRSGWNTVSRSYPRT